MIRLSEMPYETDKYCRECQYNPKARVANITIKESRLFDYAIDEISGEDLFYGMLGLTEFGFSELTITQISESVDSKGNRSRKETRMFDGILFMADFHKEFSGVTLLKSANLFTRGAIGRLFQPLRNTMTVFSGEKKRGIKLENEDFNHAFDIQTTDDITARYILTLTMMERILNFKNRKRSKVEISFVHSSMYVAISSNKDYFEPKLFKPFEGFQNKIVYDDLGFLFGLIEEFDLNTRIWSKE